MKPRQQFGAINGTGCIRTAHVLKVNGAPLVQPPEQGHLSDTERTGAIEPDREPGCLRGGLTQFASVGGWRRVQRHWLRSGVIVALRDSSTFTRGCQIDGGAICPTQYAGSAFPCASPRRPHLLWHYITNGALLNIFPRHKGSSAFQPPARLGCVLS